MSLLLLMSLFSVIKQQITCSLFEQYTTWRFWKVNWTNAYVPAEFWQDKLLLRRIDSLTKSNFKIDKIDLPTFYWLPKLHKIPYKSRFILKASAHSFKQFTSRLLKSTFSLSMHIYNSDGRHASFHLHGISRPDRSASEASKYKMKNSLSTVGLEPSTLRSQVWCSTYWASRAWWMLSV